MAKITINQFVQSPLTDGWRVEYGFQIEGKSYQLFYLIHGGGISRIPECCDALIVTLLYHAIYAGLDIESTIPISEKLFYHLTYHVIPQLTICNSGVRHITIIAPHTDKHYAPQWIGTGISCGIDSLATISEYTAQCRLDSYRLTHLVYCKVGAAHGNKGYYEEKTQESKAEEELKNVRLFCKENNFPLIVVESNVAKILNEAFFYEFDRTHIYRNCGCILLLQHLFKRYYYASTYNLDKFSATLSNDCAHYEKWLLPLLGNENTEFYSANQAWGRIEKTRIVGEFPPSYHHLQVCWVSSCNCGHCIKCIRTLVTLDLLGQLSNFGHVFSLEDYLRKKRKILAMVYILRYRDPFFQTIYKYMRENHVPMPSCWSILVMFLRLVCWSFFHKSNLQAFIKQI